ncbi:MAG: CHAT domain-containing protein [Bacteroidota bacterium]
MEAIKTEIKALIAKGNLKKVFSYLKTINDQLSPQEQNDVISLSRQFKKTSRDEMMGNIDSREAGATYSKLTTALLALADNLGEEDEAFGEAGDTPPANQKTKILFLAANPSQTGRLKLDQEIREIEEGLRRSNHRDSFELVQKWAIRPADLRRAMLDENPQIVHFSGHGVTQGLSGEAKEGTRSLFFEEEKISMQDYDGGIVIEDNDGSPKVLPAATLGKLFELFAGKVRCVLLNACYSESQAKELKPHIPYIIGMNDAVPDNAAIVFATGFYDALGAGKDIEQAFEHGKVAVEFEGIPGADIMVLDTQ